MADIIIDIHLPDINLLMRMASQKVLTPVEIGVQYIYNLWHYWIPAFAGMTKVGIFTGFSKPSKLMIS